MNRDGPRSRVPANPRLLVTSGVAELDPTGLDAFRDAGFELIERYDLSGTADALALGNALDGVWCTLAGTELYSREVLASAEDLCAIARAGVGFDSIDVGAATDQGIAVLTTPGTNLHSVADFTLALMLACLRELPEIDHAVRGGRWRPTRLGRDLTGATVGIVGLGSIGLAVAQRLRGFECRVLGIDPEADLARCALLGIDVVTLDEALQRVDVLSLHVPLTDATRKMIGARELAQLRPGAVVVNTARGEVIDQAALVCALQRGHLRGAGLDVFEREPLPANHPLTRLNGVLLAGHVAALTERSVKAMLESVLQGLHVILMGKLPRNCINAAELVRSGHWANGRVIG